MTFALVLAFSIIVGILALATLFTLVFWSDEDKRNRQWWRTFRYNLLMVSAFVAGLGALFLVVLLFQWLWSSVPEQEFPW